MWECPDYFEVDGKGITVFSPMAFLNDGKAYDSAAICLFSTFDEATGTMQLADDVQFLDYGLISMPRRVRLMKMAIVLLLHG